MHLLIILFVVTYVISAANDADREDWIQCIETAMSSSFEIGRLYVDIIDARFKFIGTSSNTFPFSLGLCGIYDVQGLQKRRSTVLSFSEDKGSNLFLYQAFHLVGINPRNCMHHGCPYLVNTNRGSIV